MIAHCFSFPNRQSEGWPCRPYSLVSISSRLRNRLLPCQPSSLDCLLSPLSVMQLPPSLLLPAPWLRWTQKLYKNIARACDVSLSTTRCFVVCIFFKAFFGAWRCIFFPTTCISKGDLNYDVGELWRSANHIDVTKIICAEKEISCFQQKGRTDAKTRGDRVMQQ